MTKFKIGNRVKLKNLNGIIHKNGQIGTIIKIGNEFEKNNVQVKLDSFPFLDIEGDWFLPECVALIKEQDLKQYDIDKWLNDNNAFNYTGNKSSLLLNILFFTDSILAYKFDNVNSTLTIPLGLFNDDIMWFVETCNKKGANLSYPEEIKPFTKEDAIAKLKANDFSKPDCFDNCWVHKSDFMINIDTLVISEKNINRVIEAAKLTAKIEKV